MLKKVLIAVLVLFFLFGGYIAFTAITLPNVRLALETGVEPSQTSQVLARDKSVIMSYGKFQHKPVPLSQMPPALIEALLATEDRRFYSHRGVDPIGILRAIVTDIRHHGMREGGSTLTQQLARNIFLSNERSLSRKIKEALLAIKLEQQLSKDQILELYLNNVYFGEGAYGVGAASNIYFGKKPEQLTEAEAALLAGLPQAPSLYSPFANPDLALKRREKVLHNLVETGKMSAEEAERVGRTRLHINPNGQALSSADKAPFFNRHVINEVCTMLDMDEQTFWQQGLKVYTTLDPRAQRLGERAVRSVSAAYGRNRLKQQAALFSVDNQGRILAYVGGKNFNQSQFDRVSQAHRLAGSLFKVFVYTTAIEHGITPLTVYRDAPVTFGNWTPSNYDKGHHGFMTLARALAQSNNIIAVKLLNDLSSEAVIQTAQRMGIQSKLDPNLALALGAADVTLFEMTQAFSVLSDNGDYVPAYSIEKIVDHRGQVLYQHRSERKQVLQRPSRDTVVSMMRGVVLYGTGKGAAIGRDIAGKTGTSDEYRDAWFIGFSPEVTTGVWVGNDDNTTMPGITGGSIPARIWQTYMSRLLAGLPKKEFDVKSGQPLEEKDFFVYSLSNLSASEGQAKGGNEEVPSEDNGTTDTTDDTMDTETPPENAQDTPGSPNGGNPVPDNPQSANPDGAGPTRSRQMIPQNNGYGPQQQPQQPQQAPDESRFFAPNRQPQQPQGQPQEERF